MKTARFLCFTLALLVGGILPLFAQSVAMNAEVEYLPANGSPPRVLEAFKKKHPELSTEAKGVDDMPVNYLWGRRKTDSHYQVSYSYKSDDMSKYFELNGVIDANGKWLAQVLLLKGETIIYQYVKKEVYAAILKDFLPRTRSSNFTFYSSFFPEGAYFSVADYSNGLGVFYKYDETGKFLGKE